MIDDYLDSRYILKFMWEAGYSGPAIISGFVSPRCAATSSRRDGPRPALGPPTLHFGSERNSAYIHMYTPC